MKILSGPAMAAAFFAFAASAATATTLSVDTNISNYYNIYISTDDSVAGTEFMSGVGWQITDSGSTDLVDGNTYYLHILASELAGPRMLLGQFELSDADFAFTNGTQRLVSGDSGLLVSDSGWGGYGATHDLGPNGSLPWGTLGPALDADFVWTNPGYDTAWFSAEIVYQGPTAVPLSAGLPLLGVALGGFAVLRRRRKAA